MDMEQEDNNQEQQCRLCDQTTDPMWNILDTVADDRQLLHHINDSLPVIVYRKDPLSKQVCDLCYNKLLVWIQFKKTSKCVDDKRKQLLHQQTTNGAVADSVQLYLNCQKETIKTTIDASVNTCFENTDELRLCKKCKCDTTNSDETALQNDVTDYDHDDEDDDDDDVEIEAPSVYTGPRVSNVFQEMEDSLDGIESDAEVEKQPETENNDDDGDSEGEPPPPKRRRLDVSLLEDEAEYRYEPASLLQLTLNVINSLILSPDVEDAAVAPVDGDVDGGEESGFIVDFTKQYLASVTCVHCGGKFPNRKRLAVHERRHMAVDLGSKVDERTHWSDNKCGRIRNKWFIARYGPIPGYEIPPSPPLLPENPPVDVVELQENHLSPPQDDELQQTHEECEDELQETREEIEEIPSKIVGGYKLREDRHNGAEHLDRLEFNDVYEIGTGEDDPLIELSTEELEEVVLVDGRAMVNGVPLMNYSKERRKAFYRIIRVGGANKKFCSLCRYCFKDNWAIEGHYSSLACFYTCRYCGLRFNKHRHLFGDHIRKHKLRNDPFSRKFYAGSVLNIAPKRNVAPHERVVIKRQTLSGLFAVTYPQHKQSQQQKNAAAAAALNDSGASNSTLNQRPKRMTALAAAAAQITVKNEILEDDYIGADYQPSQSSHAKNKSMSAPLAAAAGGKPNSRAYFCRKCYKVFFKLDEFNAHNKSCDLAQVQLQRLSQQQHQPSQPTSSSQQNHNEPEVLMNNNTSNNAGGKSLVSPTGRPVRNCVRETKTYRDVEASNFEPSYSSSLLFDELERKPRKSAPPYVTSNNTDNGIQMMLDNNGSSSSVNKYVCFICNTPFPNIYSRNSHMRVHKGQRQASSQALPTNLPSLLQAVPAAKLSARHSMGSSNMSGSIAAKLPNNYQNDFFSNHLGNQNSGVNYHNGNNHHHRQDDLMYGGHDIKQEPLEPEVQIHEDEDDDLPNPHQNHNANRRGIPNANSGGLMGSVSITPISRNASQKPMFINPNIMKLVQNNPHLTIKANKGSAGTSGTTIHSSSGLGSGGSAGGGTANRPPHDNSKRYGTINVKNPSQLMNNHHYQSMQPLQVQLQSHSQPLPPIVVHSPSTSPVGDDGDNKQYRCSSCWAPFLNKSLLYFHKKTQCEGSKYPCPFCKKRFGTESAYSSHIFYSHPE